MLVYVSGRAGGKTNALVRWFLEHPQHRAVIVADKRRRNHFLHTLYKLSGYSRVTFRRFEDNVIDVSQVFGRFSVRGTGVQEIGIDDAELIISNLIGTKIDFMAMNATLLDFRYVHPNEQTDYVDGEVIPDYDNESTGLAKQLGRERPAITYRPE